MCHMTSITVPLSSNGRHGPALAERAEREPRVSHGRSWVLESGPRMAVPLMIGALVITTSSACRGYREESRPNDSLQSAIDDCVVAELLRQTDDARTLLRKASPEEAARSLYFDGPDRSLCDLRDEGRAGSMLGGRGIRDVFDRTEVIAMAVQHRLRDEPVDAESIVRYVIDHPPRPVR